MVIFRSDGSFEKNYVTGDGVAKDFYKGVKVEPIDYKPSIEAMYESLRKNTCLYELDEGALLNIPYISENISNMDPVEYAKRYDTKSGRRTGYGYIKYLEELLAKNQNKELDASEKLIAGSRQYRDLEHKLAFLRKYEPIEIVRWFDKEKGLIEEYRNEANYNDENKADRTLTRYSGIRCEVELIDDQIDEAIRLIDEILSTSQQLNTRFNPNTTSILTC